MSYSRRLQATPSDEVLVQCLARVAAGDRHALAQVYQLTSGRLNALLIRMLREQAAVEDVLQEVYMAAWKYSASFDPSLASPVTWLVTIARNKAIDRLRSDRARIASMEPIEEKTDLLDPTPSVADELERGQDYRRLHACLDRLGGRQSAAIRAAFFEGATYEALAAREAVPVGTMKSWIRRGLLRLRTCLDSVHHE